MKKILFIFILIFSLISLFIHNNYYFSENIFISASIATPIFNVHFGKTTILNNNNLSTQYNFKVRNFNENLISEIPFKYYFLLDNIPKNLDIIVFRNSQKIFLHNFRSDYFVLNSSKKEEDIFYIQINYTGNFYEPFLSTFKIKVFYEQI